MNEFQTVFVTVGTTKFDDLLVEVDSMSFQTLLQKSYGTKKVIVQYGNSQVQPRSMTLFELYHLHG